MKKIKTLLILFILFASSIFAQKKMNSSEKFMKLEIEMYPKAKTGINLFYFQLPIINNEENYKIELFVGKEQEVDCNNYFMVGEIKEEMVEGWQYPYYTIDSNGVTAGTLMGCLDNKKSKKFIAMPSKTIRYNSKLPIVVYLPDGFVAKYKIWTATPDFKEIRNIKK